MTSSKFFVISMISLMVAGAQAIAAESRVLPIVNSQIVVGARKSTASPKIADVSLELKGQLQNRAPVQSTVAVTYVEGRLSPEVVCAKWRCQARVQADGNFLRVIVLLDTNRDGKVDFQRTLPVARIAANGSVELLAKVVAEPVLVQERFSLNEISVNPSLRDRDYVALNLKLN